MPVCLAILHYFHTWTNTDRFIDQKCLQWYWQREKISWYVYTISHMVDTDWLADQKCLQLYYAKEKMIKWKRVGL